MIADEDKIFVITAPSGTGKTTLNRRLVEELADVEIAISLTTRELRDSETNGDHYWFVDQREFQTNIDSGKMLEWAEVFGNYYGTNLDEVERIQAAGKKVILEIDVQGWNISRKKIPNAQSIFIFPPSMKILWGRLTERGTDSLAICKKRIATAREELNHIHLYENYIINENLDSAFGELKEILEGKLNSEEKKKAGVKHGKTLIDECNEAWYQELNCDANV